jgi:hypothetical protein
MHPVLAFNLLCTGLDEPGSDGYMVHYRTLFRGTGQRAGDAPGESCIALSLDDHGDEAGWA